MSKCASSNEAELEHTQKHIQLIDRNCRPAPLADAGAWELLEKYLTTDMTYPQLEEEFSSYLGDRYIFNDWKDARDALFSSDGNDSIALANLRALKTSHIPLLSSSPRTDGPSLSTPVEWCRPPKSMMNHLCPKSNLYILTEADEDDDDEEEEEDDSPSVQLLEAAHHFGPSAKDRLAATFDTIFARVKESLPIPSEPCLGHPRKTVLSSRAIEGRMYLLHVNTSLIVISGDSRDYIAEHLRSRGFNVTASIWTAGQLIFKSQKKNAKQLMVQSPNSPNQRGSVALLNRFRLLDDHTSGFDTPFVKKTLAAFLMQFLRIGDSARIISGELCSKIGTVVSTGHASGSVCLEIILDGHQSEIDVRLEDMERLFLVSDEVWVVAGPYLGLEGYIIQISDDMFHVCQHVSKEEVLVSRKCGIVEWIPMGGTMLWFRDANPVLPEDNIVSSVGSWRVQVPVTLVWWIKLPHMIKYTKEKGYDIRPGDVLWKEIKRRYARRTRLGFLLQYPEEIRSITPPPVQLPSNSADDSLSPWTTCTANAEGDCLLSSVAPSLPKFDPWIVNPKNIQDSIDARAENLPHSAPLPWLMGKEYSLTFLLHHTVLKVAVGFMGGRLHKHFVSTACPDRFCVFCTSSNAGAVIQHSSPTTQRKSTGLRSGWGFLQSCALHDKV
ncbi:hypothetical protein EV702DRAFT_1052638 [Suillus placidus]|uniref:KOW domain-containing protein n=1 Tax=Suillus placidus TaxID=48579 RepID=A0A9P6ZEZ8_9AGAM|nr:hypothetical protein EV702DRAFT_1052638 [Suillus placidus]